MIEDVNITEYVEIDEEDAIDIDFESVSFIDFLKMANNAWKNDAPFDIDMDIIKEASMSTPIKVLQRRTVTINDADMYEIWGGLKMKNLDYLVAVRFHALIEDYNLNSFNWKVSTPSQSVDLDSIIKALEDHQSGQWESLLQ